MHVKIGKLCDQLSHYLKRVRQTGDRVIVMERDKPIAEIRSYRDPSESEEPADVWASREHFER